MWSRVLNKQRIKTGSLKASAEKTKELEVTKRTANQSRRLKSYHHRGCESQVLGDSQKLLRAERERTRMLCVFDSRGFPFGAVFRECESEQEAGHFIFSHSVPC